MTPSIKTTGPMTLVVGWRSGNAVELGRVKLTAAVAKKLREFCVAAVDSLATREQKSYSAEATVEPEEYMTVPRTTLSEENAVLSTVQGATRFAPVNARHLPEKPLLFYACVVGRAASQRVAFVRNTNPHLNAKTGRFMTALGDSLATLNRKVFSFEAQIDLIVLPDEVLVLNWPSFERLFRDEPTLLAEIPTWLDEVAEYLPIEEAAVLDLKERCRSDGRLRRRLRAIHERGHLAHVTIDQLGDEAKRQGIEPSLVIRDGKLNVGGIDAMTLLKLLNEDLMTGGLSGTRFSVERKAPRGANK
jgi:Domain of unknown function (DUF4868)